MNLNFKSLQHLNTHSTFLNELFQDQQLFIVWGTVRDLLLWRTDSPTDIDLTCLGDPDKIWEAMQFNEETMSRFRTEKFGTMTVIPKLSDWSSSEIHYELTPFRAEWDYTDMRHPDEVTRSDSLVSDSARRDFTINGIYRTASSATISCYEPHWLSKKNPFQTALQKHLPIVFPQHNLIILTDYQHVQDYVKTGTLPSSGIGFAYHDGVTSVTTSESVVDISQIIIDPQWWLLDLLARKIKTVWDPATRYQEDALRLMRGLRFVNTLNQWLPWSEKQNCWFDLEKRTREQLVVHADLISHVAAERHHQELTKVFIAQNPFGYISTLKTAGLMPHIFPCLSQTINNHQPTRHHALDTYSHSIMVLYHLQQRVADPLVRFATLYHDVGKPEQYEFMEKAKAIDPINPDREGFEHHADISVRLAQIDFRKLAFPKAHIEKICRYIKLHHRPWEILDSNIKKRDHKLRKLISEWGYQETLRLIDIAIADRLGQYNPIQAPAIQELLAMQKRVTELYQDEWRFLKKDLVVNGNRLMNEFDLQPGPQLWEILDKAFEWVLGDVTERNTEKQIGMLVRGMVK